MAQYVLQITLEMVLCGATLLPMQLPESAC